MVSEPRSLPDVGCLEGNFQSHVEDLKKHQGPGANQPHRIAHKKLGGRRGVRRAPPFPDARDASADAKKEGPHDVCYIRLLRVAVERLGRYAS